jgi:hypothetical protein
MRRPTRRDERGLVGVVLTIVIVFALIAVVELTRTLEAAQQIDTRVVDIRGSISSANTHLNTGCDVATNTNCTSDALPVLNTTIGLVKQIDTAAKPLTGEAGQILTDVNSINATVSQILANASSINGTVHSINASATSIGGSVNTISASLSAVNADVSVIQQGLVRANNQAIAVANFVNGIKGDTATISAEAGGAGGGILYQATTICKNPLLIGDKC